MKNNEGTFRCTFAGRSRRCVQERRSKQNLNAFLTLVLNNIDRVTGAESVGPDAQSLFFFLLAQAKAKHGVSTGLCATVEPVFAAPQPGQ